MNKELIIETGQKLGTYSNKEKKIKINMTQLIKYMGTMNDKEIIEKCINNCLLADIDCMCLIECLKTENAGKASKFL